MANKIMHLPTFGLLKVSGTDAKKLLQGQLTCDVEQLTTNSCLMGAHCNPQGRIISLFGLIFFKDAYYLILPRNMIVIAATALKKFAVFYKVELTDASESLHMLGYIGTDAKKIADKIQNDSIKVFGDETRTVIVGEPAQLELIFTELSKSADIASVDTWKLADLRMGIPSIHPETTGKFLPHELNLQDLGAISFDKGCYTGQEIIARMHYRGKLKKHTYRATIQNDAALLPGSEVYYSQEQRNQGGGVIIDSVIDENKHCLALIMTDEANAKNEHLFMDSNNQQFFTFAEQAKH